MITTQYSISRLVTIAVLTFIICSAAITPVLAATKYTQGAPEFSASVDGINEFSQGQDAMLRILVKNTGLNEFKQLDLGTIDSEDLPSTAKLVTVGLTSANTEIVSKTDPIMAGDIQGNGKPVPLSFAIKITDNATAGDYQLPLTIQYRYVRPIAQEAADTFQFTYDTANVTLPITVRIKPAVKIEVVNLSAEPLAPGSEGYISVKIRNAGPETGKMATAKIIRNGNSAVIPADGSVFIGSFAPGDTSDCRFKISVSDDALNKTYPMDIAVTYTNREGNVVTSGATTIGIPVSGKPPLTVISPAPVLAQGSGDTIEIRYRNEGNMTLYDAQARLSVHDPFTSETNTAFLGTIKPGETAIAHYQIKTDSAAEAKTYALDSRIRYRDSLSISHESDTIPVILQVEPAEALPAGTLLLFIGIIAILGAGAVLWHYRRGRNQE